MPSYSFGNFELDIEQRSLKKQGRVVRIGSRAFEMLSILIARAGDIVTKEEIMKAAWPSTVVDDGALRVHLVGLRRVIYDGELELCIRNIPGRGYQFMKPVIRTDSPSSESSTLPPRRLQKPLGQEDFVTQSAEILRKSRLVTLVGPGGIGKSTVAAETARIAGGENEIVHVDVGEYGDPASLEQAIAEKTGKTSRSDLTQIADFVGSKRLLLVLDNCEHLIQQCADVAEYLVSATTNLKILATSREPLRANYERVREVRALAVPAPGSTRQEIKRSPAVKLLLARSCSADAVNGGSDKDYQAVAEVVRKLEGVPLAIELAARRLGDMRLDELVIALDDPFAVLTRGTRTAPARQRSLSASIGWSYHLLTEDEKSLLGILGELPPAFTEAEAWLVSSKQLDRDEYEDALRGLMAKSLVSYSHREATFTMLSATRNYALRRTREYAGA